MFNKQKRYFTNLTQNHGYLSGGAGYVMSKEAIRRLGSALEKDIDFCENTGTEDVDVDKCFRKLDVYPKSSVDEFERERFVFFFIFT